MPLVDNTTPRSRAVAAEQFKSRTFTRDENDHSDQSIRRYFTKLMISGGQGQRLRSGPWELMPIEHFFLSLNTKMQPFNPERQPCSQGVATVAAVFEGFIWD